MSFFLLNWFVFASIISSLYFLPLLFLPLSVFFFCAEFLFPSNSLRNCKLEKWKVEEERGRRGFRVSFSPIGQPSSMFWAQEIQILFSACSQRSLKGRFLKFGKHPTHLMPSTLCWCTVCISTVQLSVSNLLREATNTSKVRGKWVLKMLSEDVRVSMKSSLQNWILLENSFRLKRNIHILAKFNWRRLKVINLIIPAHH